MLRRISADRFQTVAGQPVQLVLRSSQNNGINSGQFHYNGQPLDDEQIQGLPGCSLVPVAGVRQFRVNVDFDPAAGNARYDLFEIDPDNGSQIDLEEQRLASDPDGIIGFGIDGSVAAEADAPAARERRAPVRKKAAKRAKRKTARPRARGASTPAKAKNAKKATNATGKANQRVKKAKKR
jgi:hypothetical protein